MNYEEDKFTNHPTNIVNKTTFSGMVGTSEIGAFNLEQVILLNIMSILKFIFQEQILHLEHLDHHLENITNLEHLALVEQG